MSTPPSEPQGPVARQHPPEPPPPRRQGRKSARDMVISLAVLAAFLVPVLLLVPRPAQVERPPVDVVGTAAGAQPRADFPLVVPAVPDGWEPNAARLEPGADGRPTWVVGWVTTQDGYAGLRVAADASPRWLEDATAAGDPAGTQDVAGQPWDLFAAPDADAPTFALAREADGVTTVVVGTAQVPELVQLAAAVQEEQDVQEQQPR